MNDFEKNNIKRLIVLNQAQKKNFWWSLFYKCNKNCPNCVQKEMPRYGLNNINIDELILKAKKINEYTEYYKINALNLMGGEITILNINDLCNILSFFNLKRYNNIRIYSNMTTTPEYYFAMINSLNNVQKITLLFSYHSSIFDIDDFFNVLDNIYNKIKSVHNVCIKLQFTLTKNMLSLVDTFYNYLTEFNKRNNCSLKVMYSPDLGVNKDFSCYKRENSVNLEQKKYSRITTNLPVIIEYNNNKKEISNLNILRNKKEINFFNLKCYKTDSVWLYDNDLRSYCSQCIISKDFLKDNIEQMSIPKYFICKSQNCLLVEGILKIEK